MKERPIIFSGPMVRAILAGKKTQTRRAAGLDRFNESPDLWRLGKSAAEHHAVFHGPGPCRSMAGALCRYGCVGDRLWAKERWRIAGDDHIQLQPTSTCTGPQDVIFFGHYADQKERDSHRWRSPMLMPRWASRLTLQIVGINVQRVQAISEIEALAEGLEPPNGPAGTIVPTPVGPLCLPKSTGRDIFALVWDHLNEKKGLSWRKNPWVWVIEFKVVEGRAA